MPKRKLVILDVDNTLMHSYQHLPLRFMKSNIKVDDRNKKEIKETQENHPQVIVTSEYSFVTARPYLSYFIEQLINNPVIDIAVFSAARMFYLEETINLLEPRLFENALFVWSYESGNISSGDYPRKQLESVKNIYGYQYQNMYMIDDMPYVQPQYCHIDIPEFYFYSMASSRSMEDKELIRMLIRLEVLLSIECLETERKRYKKICSEYDKNYNQWMNENGVSIFNDDYHEKMKFFPIIKPKAIDEISDNEVDEYLVRNKGINKFIKINE